MCSEERARSWHLQKELWSQSTLRPWRIIKVPSVLLSRGVSLCPLLLLLLLRSLFLFCSAWSVSALGGSPIHLIHTRQMQPRSGAVSFSFLSRRQRLPRHTLTHCKVMLKYFQTETLSLFQRCSFSSAAAAQTSKATFLCLWEKRKGRL